MSEVKVNKISPRTNCGTTTLGDSGDSFVIPSGVTITNNGTQTGFGRTGTVNWQTTPKTGNFAAVNGEGYFVNTTSGAVTMTMPSGSAGAIVSIQDYNKTFDSNALTVTPASGEKINGGDASASLIIATEGQGLTFVYVDSTVGWKTVHENEFTAGGATHVIATGGTITCCGDYKIHTFTGPGTFTVTSAGAGTQCAPSIADYLVIGGGGGGGGNLGAGAGAGGFREGKAAASPTHTAPPHSASPVAATTGITLSAQAYTITVGSGGAGIPAPTTGPGSAGNVSTFSTITAAAGGFGAGGAPPAPSGPGGSGGGSGGYGSPGSGGCGNTPPVSPSQGNPGGGTPGGNPPYASAGGGGIGGAGVTVNSTLGRPGGDGLATSITGSSVTRAGGGAGSPYGSATDVIPNNPGGGPGGGGMGANPSSPAPDRADMNGDDNTGGGGGGTGEAPKTIAGGNGGSGIVVIRYKYQ